MNSVVTGLPASMTEIMAPWTLQEGYPIVRVMSQETGGIKIKQVRDFYYKINLVQQTLHE